MLRTLLTMLFCIGLLFINAQTCTDPGQNPQTAFPVCGTGTFSQSSVPLCGNRAVAGPCGGGLTDKNPYWYKFTCFTTGTLGFLISPLAANEDYDWQLFNVTGVTNLNDVYTNPALFVTCNWSQYYGNTGATAAGTAAFSCGGATPQFTRMPTIVAGNQYLLLVSHWSDGQSGYNLSFGGGTASITDTVTAHIRSATAPCDGNSIMIKLNKKMRCASLATNGSDFQINTAATSIIGATGFGCNGGFDLDSIQLLLSSPLPAGTYRIKARAGTDANTLLDVCGASLPIGDSVDVIIPAQVPLPMDSIRLPTVCSPQSLILQFSGYILCNTIAPDGSDFTITGPTPVAIRNAVGNCSIDGLARTIIVTLTNPIQVGGTYTIRLQNGTDGNTLLNNCMKATPDGSALTFIVRDAVSANFTSATVYNQCAAVDTVKYAHPGGNGITQWNWTMTGGIPATSVMQTPVATYAISGTYNTKLVVSNGFCKDSVTVPVTINAIQKDTVFPKLATAIAPCDAVQIIVKLNKKIRCASIAANGSDFIIRPALAQVVSATGIACNNAAETDSVVINLGSALPTGSYTLVLRNGSDGNTLLDNCNRSISVDDSIRNIQVVLHPLVSMDSVGKVGCKPIELFLYFKESVLCSSIATNGSDFTVAGPATVTISQASGGTNCTNGLTNSIKLTLSSVITTGGTYIITLNNGTDGNTLLNECGKAALANQSLSFTAGDTISAAFTYAVVHACPSRDTLSFFHAGQNGVNQWQWGFDNGARSTLQNPVIIYSTYGTRPVNLWVSNGFCADSATQNIFIASDTLQALFEASPFLCPGEPVKIVNTSTGNIATYSWDYGDGFSFTGATPPAHTYAVPLTQQDYMIKLTITGSLGCSVNNTTTVKALNNCLVAVPTAFTPNGDGLNDYLYPTNAFKADKLSFKVFNRLGQLVFESRNMTQKWDGKMNGTPQGAGAYIWFLNYTDIDTGKPVSQKGTTILIR